MPMAVVSGDLMAGSASTSDLPRLKIDARIDPRVSQIGEQIHHHADEGKDIKRSKYHRIVAIEHALKSEQAEAVEREDCFDQQRAGEESVHEGAGEAGDHDQHGIAE